MHDRTPTLGTPTLEKPRRCDPCPALTMPPRVRVVAPIVTGPFIRILQNAAYSRSRWDFLAAPALARVSQARVDKAIGPVTRVRRPLAPYTGSALSVAAAARTTMPITR